MTLFTETRTEGHPAAFRKSFCRKTSTLDFTRVKRMRLSSLYRWCKVRIGKYYDQSTDKLRCAKKEKTSPTVTATGTPNIGPDICNGERSHPTSPEIRQSHFTAPHSCRSVTPSLVAEAATAVAAAACLQQDSIEIKGNYNMVK